MVELEAPASRAELEEELTFARLELAKREVSEGNAVEEQHRLERMLRDSQRFLVEHEVKLAEAKRAAAKVKEVARLEKRKRDLSNDSPEAAYDDEDEPTAAEGPRRQSKRRRTR